MLRNRYFASLGKSAACAVVAGLLAASPAAADTWRLSTKLPSDSPEGQLHQKFADLVAEYTGGDVNIEIYPSEQLGDAQSVLEQVSSGVIDIFSDDVTYLDKWNPAISWISAPFLFDSRAHWACFLKSDYFVDVLDEARQESGITVIGNVGPIIRGPYRVFVSKDQVTGLDDLAGTKLRIWDNALIVDVWSALGADVHVMAWTDVYQALQTGNVEAVTSPMALVDSMKFTEVAPNVARTDEFNQALVYMINENSWSAISDEDKEGVLRAYAEVGEESHAAMGDIAASSIERMKSAGTTYAELDTAPFIERAAAIYKDREAAGDIPAGFLTAVDAARSSCN